MWIATPDLDAENEPVLGVIHVDCILRACHLLPVYGPNFVPPWVNFTNVLDSYPAFYVNKFIDHHANEIAF
jgi:hypothetical protein